MLVLISLGYLWAAIFLLLSLLGFTIAIAWKSILKEHSKLYIRIENSESSRPKV